MTAGVGVRTHQVPSRPEALAPSQTGNRDGTGQYGIEQSYQAALAGEPRVLVTQRDASGQPILDEATVTQDGVPGTDLRLTVDAGLQLRVEQELLAAWVADRAKRASAVVMDPYTGEIYAMATYPSYDANDYKAIAAVRRLDLQRATQVQLDCQLADRQLADLVE